MTNLKEKVNIENRMEIYLKEAGMKIKYQDMEYILELMETNLKETGQGIKFKEKESLNQ